MDDGLISVRPGHQIDPDAAKHASWLCDNRCIITIGASAGGVEALQRLMKELSADIPAAVFIVLHVGATSHLADILDRAGPLPVVNAVSGAPIEIGRAYVAPPGAHLLLHDSHMMLRRGPRENLARPAIDPLFRSAACSYGSRVVGVVLTGSLSDGTAGLRAVKACGGTSVVQHPDDATVPDMVLSALRHVEIDHCVPLSGMAALLGKLAGEAAGETPEIPSGIRLEAAIAAQEHGTMKTEDRLGDLSVFVCPECHGPLWEIADGPMVRYRCHTGHAFTADVMMEAQSSEAEQILWSLLRAHQQRAELARRMAKRERLHKRHELAAQLSERAKEYKADAELVQQIIEKRHGGGSQVLETATTSGGNGID
ncbi:chemotaxis protein CheB [Mesorhizobium sp. WSM2239]|uniref:protein-glutamate methylesterase n=2 Tax=unclassified Mesorhizobium TaxID=325217 RepID=A0AAU8DG15_9HYPH